MTVEGQNVWRSSAELAIGHPLSPIEATVIRGDLAARDVHVDFCFGIDGWVHLWPTEPPSRAAPPPR
jgi:hypothetical protein